MAASMLGMGVGERCGEGAPASPGREEPPTPAGRPHAPVRLGCAWLRQCEHTIIHYNSITVIKAGGMQRQEGVLPTEFTLRVISER